MLILDKFKYTLQYILNTGFQLYQNFVLLLFGIYVLMRERTTLQVLNVDILVIIIGKCTYFIHWCKYLIALSLGSQYEVMGVLLPNSK